MNGELWVESEVGEGSEFHFTVRFGIAKDAPEHSWFVIEELADMPVLVVDDNNTNRRILQDVLTNWGMQPSLAVDGPEALAKLDEAAQRGEPFRLVLLDVMMPDMDGFMVAERVRQNPRLNDCTLIMLSSAGQTESPERCKELGIARYLIKPVKQSDLRETILRVLSEKGDCRPRLTPAEPAEAAANRSASCSPRTASSTRKSLAGCWSGEGTRWWWQTMAAKRSRRSSEKVSIWC